MNTKPPFFNPEDCPFEILGFYEDIMEPETGHCYGTRTIKEPDRPLGSDGRLEYDITETLWLKKGHRRVEFKASKEKPRRVCGMLQILCGRMKVNLEAEKNGTFYPQDPNKMNKKVK